MPLSEIMQGIEADRFASELNLAPGTRAFRRGLRAHELFRRLAELAREDDAREAVERRVADLATTAIDDGYENRFDAALSAYLTVLGDTAEPDIVARAAVTAAAARNIWWTVGISRDLIAHAVATGAAQAAAPAHVLPAVLAQGGQWQEALNKAIHRWLKDSAPPFSAGDDAGRRMLNLLGLAQAKAQMPKTNNVIIMPTEEGERLVWKARVRSRAARVRTAGQAGGVHARGRQLARV